MEERDHNDGIYQMPRRVKCVRPPEKDHADSDVHRVARVSIKARHNQACRRIPRRERALVPVEVADAPQQHPRPRDEHGDRQWIDGDVPGMTIEPGERHQEGDDAREGGESYRGAERKQVHDLSHQPTFARRSSFQQHRRIDTRRLGRREPCREESGNDDRDGHHDSRKMRSTTEASAGSISRPPVDTVVTIMVRIQLKWRHEA